MSHVLAVAALKLRHPVRLVVLMESGDTAVHDGVVPAWIAYW
jgi:hypothetical protein